MGHRLHQHNRRLRTPAVHTYGTALWGRQPRSDRETKDGTYVVCADGVDLLDVVRERRRLVYEQLQEVVRRRLAGEKAELEVDRAPPGEDHAGRNLQRRLGVSAPAPQGELRL